MSACSNFSLRFCFNSGAYLENGFIASLLVVTLGAHAQEVTVLVLSVCYHLIVNIVRFYGLSKVRTLAWIFEKTSRSKVKANMQMSSYRSRPVLARFE